MGLSCGLGMHSLSGRSGVRASKGLTRLVHSAMLPTSLIVRLAKASTIQQARSLSSLPLTIKQVLSRTPETQADSTEPDSPVTVHGWIKSIRKLKKFAFAEIRDGTTHNTLQVVLTAEQAKP